MGDSPGAGRWKHRTERHNQQYTNEKQNCEYEESCVRTYMQRCRPGSCRRYCGTRNLAGVTVVIEITRGLATTQMQNKKQQQIANKVEQMLGPDAAKFFKSNTMTREDIVFVTDVALGHIARVYKAQ